MNAPQIILIVWLTVGLTGNLFLHGQEEKRDFFVTFLRCCILVGILVWGGFFK